MRELTESEMKIALARDLEGCGNPQVHDGAWFLGRIKESDTSVEPTAFTMECYSCRQDHIIFERDVRYISRTC